MSAKLVKLDKKDHDDSNIINFFEICLDRARRGEFNGAVVIVDVRDGTFEQSRINMDILTSAAVLTRALYRVNTDWDEL